MSTQTNIQPKSLFIGLGNMGRPMVAQYSTEFPAYVYDINAETARDVAQDTGTLALTDLADLPEGIETVILMLPNSKIVEETLQGKEGLFQQLTAGALVIDMSSSEPGSTRALSSEAAELGLSLVDAPVSGGVLKAKTGKLSVMVGGDEDAVETAMPHLETMAGAIVKAGPSGAGHAAKALNNLLSATNLAAAAEILCVAQANGIEPSTMVDVINSSTSRSQATEVKYPKHILTGTFDSGFAMDLMIKDMGIAMDLIRSGAIEAPIVGLANEVAGKARTSLKSERPDHTELARYVENINHTTLRSR
ncbi:2-hydroxy-3-oxopropionate reductase [Citricoccus zhacaiensis]|uniref:2-hydroxy-3-oxopropionate reductase n=1 Tax=Citricoccus zhacaiensis TaxID=489142 RepID=A0ABQ2MCM6_9MICC|nr:NAD(P)-dependent oxidoreductase [Citricoccus zhacaiensis]GGO49568.1 2-hydroxy-3-oxopropionate reductase [Citricoccus zhacaiensis]